MKKLQRLIFSGLLVVTLAFGLAGCGSNHNSSKSSTSKDKVTKVVKKKSSSKDKQSSNKKSSSESEESSNSANSSVTTNDSESSSSSSSQQSSSQKQLGLNDVAVWTDENGITHHVDSDGMDRQTSPNQSGVTYKDWSGSLPSNAQIVKQN
ncbi:hypothetical protein [Limosilactobacillus oris]|uniref:hypothetical protein n=1 Tax=Limosilactobacillus oris TaxID=1632 RepID=UPI0024B35266|nr:hypothetical protein [Limosilactobacillus oris]WHO86042.1 hypothetical protein QLX69_02080 [Limosilactobacillus oris]